MRAKRVRVEYGSLGCTFIYEDDDGERASGHDTGLQGEMR